MAVVRQSYPRPKTHFWQGRNRIRTSPQPDNGENYPMPDGKIFGIYMETLDNWQKIHKSYMDNCVALWPFGQFFVVLCQRKE